MSLQTTRLPPDRGFAILIVLWTLVLVALIVTHMIAATREQVQLASNLRSEAVLGAAADGAVYEAVFHVLDKSAAHWAANGATHRIAGGAARIDVSVRSEAGKVNLNTARPEVLAALLRETGTAPGLASQIAANILAWRSPPGQAPETADAYPAAGYGYAPPNAPFESISELGQVLGITPEIFARVAPFLTIYHEGDTEPASAAPPVLRALQDAYGKLPVTASTADESVVEVNAVASERSMRAARAAIVRLRPSQTGPLYEILAWRNS